MPESQHRAVEAVAAATTVSEARSAVDEPVVPRGAGSQDPLIGDLRKGGLLPLLVLHFTAAEPSYGNRLMERIAALTAGALTVNPNTMYPLLRQLEAQGFVSGEWEHPERRSRRYYRITDAGLRECARLAAEVGPRLERIAASIQSIRSELSSPGEAEPSETG